MQLTVLVCLFSSGKQFFLPTSVVVLLVVVWDVSLCCENLLCASVLVLIISRLQ